MGAPDHELPPSSSCGPSGFARAYSVRAGSLSCRNFAPAKYPVSRGRGASRELAALGTGSRAPRSAGMTKHGPQPVVVRFDVIAICSSVGSSLTLDPTYHSWLPGHARSARHWPQGPAFCRFVPQQRGADPRTRHGASDNPRGSRDVWALFLAPVSRVTAGR